jgi:hypothetical protein
MKKSIVATICIALLSACTTIVETGTLPPSVYNTVGVSLDVYCGNLTNLRRIALRLIRAMDPDWTSVCEQWEDNAEVAGESSEETSNVGAQ